jgi:hypothetical protein
LSSNPSSIRADPKFTIAEPTVHIVAFFLLLAFYRNDHTPYQILVAGAGGG